MTYRPYTADDHQFVLSGWSASLRMTRDVQLIGMDDWATLMHPVIKRIIARSECIVAEGSVLQGFIAFQQPDYVLYCYVAQPFRGRGIARGLFRAADIDPSSRFRYACRTKASWECRGKISNAIYDPFHIRFSQRTGHERDHER